MGVFHKDIVFDDSQFEVMQDASGRDFLHYHGPADLSGFKYPMHSDGRPMKHAPMLFMGTDIETMPDLVEGITDISYIAAGCDKLKHGSKMPSTVLDASGAYNNCIALEEIPPLGDNVVIIDNYAANCISAEGMVNIPSSVKSAESALENCEMLGGFTGGENIEHGYAITAGCKNMILPSPDLSKDGDFTDMFVGMDKYQELLQRSDNSEEATKQSVKDYSKTVSADLGIDFDDSNDDKGVDFDNL